MAKKPTQRDIAESVTGLRGVAADLYAAAQGETVQDMEPPTVLTTVQGLTNAADFLTTVANELMELIPNRRVELGKEEPT